MYWIVPYIMLGLLIGSVSSFLYQVTVRFLHMAVRDFLLIDMIVLFLLIQFAPSKKSSVFWYNGTAHYTVPFAISLFALVCAAMLGLGTAAIAADMPQSLEHHHGGGHGPCGGPYGGPWR